MRTFDLHGLRRVQRQLRSDGIRDTSNPLRSGIHSRGFLPHVKREGASYFVTFRLADSLPSKVLIDFQRIHTEKLSNISQHDSAARHDADLDLRRQIERYLDRGAGACHLRRDDIAAAVSEALLHFHGRHYLLDEWVIMPNHAHLIIWPMPGLYVERYSAQPQTSNGSSGQSSAEVYWT